MKLWKISQDKNSEYDTYDSAIVAAVDEESARKTKVSEDEYAWAAPEFVTVDYIGEAKEDTEPGVILASFNAG